MRATRDLPRSYQRQSTLDLSRNRALLITVNLLGTALFFGFGYAFVRLAIALRLAPRGEDLVLSISPMAFPTFLLWGVVVLALTLVLHELIHAFFFWRFTKHWANFGFRGVYAFAAAPNWYIPRNQHLIITLAPLVVISAVGILLMLVVPLPLLPWLVLALVVNAAGAVGDLVTAVWLLRHPEQAYVNDYGDGMTIFAERCDRTV
jgi:hypothetical protein